MTGKNFDAHGTLALVGTVICWGTIPVFLRELANFENPAISPWLANGMRYPMAALLYWPILFINWRSGALDRKVLISAIVPAIFSLGGQVFWALAPYYISASLIGFLIKASIAWALAGALLFFPDERPLLTSKRFYVGLVLAVAGFIALSIAHGALDAEATLMGVLIVLACSFFFGCYGVSVRYFLRHTNPLLAFGVVAQYTSAGTISLMYMLDTPALVLELPARAWALIAISSLLGIGISHALYYMAIQRLGASISNLGHLAGPFVTLTFARLALGETMNTTEWGAGLCMVGGGCLLLLAQEKIKIDRVQKPTSS